MKAFSALLPFVFLVGCGGDGVTALLPNTFTAAGGAGYTGPTTFVAVTATPVGTPVRGVIFRNADFSQALTIQFDDPIANGTYEAGDGRFQTVTFEYDGVSGSFDQGTIRVESGRIVLQNATFMFVSGGNAFNATFNGSASRTLPPAL